MNKSGLIYALVCVLAFACTKPSEMHQEWIEDGEQIYAPKPEELNAYAGQDRIILGFRVYNAVNIAQFLIEYDTVSSYYNFEDYQTNYAMITTEDGVDTFVNVDEVLPGWSFVEIEINNLEEKAYTFYVSCLDADGNSSLSQQVSGTSYGEFYLSNLNNRDIDQITSIGDTTIIAWGNVLDGSIGTALKYTSSGNVTVETVLSPYAMVDSIFDGNSATMQYRAMYIPETYAVDTFYTDWESVSP